MSYGHPIPSGHGRRIPAYRWSPTVLPPSQRRTRRGRHARYSAKVPRYRFPASGRRAPAYRATRGRVCRAMPPREPSLGRLLGKGVVSLVGGVLKFLVDEAFAGRRPTKAFEQFLSFLIVLAVMASSAVGLLLGCLYFLIAYADDFAEAAAVASMEDYDEEKGRMCVTRAASVEAPPTPEELRRAWEAARGCGHLAAKLLVGTLLSNLEPAVDQSYLRAEDGTIVGRRPGLKGWLRGYCPELVPHYKALMSYKALADKLRIALGIEEPDTLSGVIDFGGVAQTGDEASFGAASPDGDAKTNEGPTKVQDVTLDGDAAKGAGGVAKGGWEKPKSLQFRKRFRLKETNEQTVMEGIHTLFADQGLPKPEPEMSMTNNLGAAERETTARAMESMAGNIAKTSVFAAEDDTTGLGMEAEPWGAAGPETMAALDAKVRERLGLCWMRRAGRRPKMA